MKSRTLACRRGRGGGGFTLIELLVVIAIIALLVSILVPSLSGVRGLAQRVVCQTQQKQFATAASQYQLDYNDAFPPFYGAHSGETPRPLWYEKELLGEYFGEDVGEIGVFDPPPKDSRLRCPAKAVRYAPASSGENAGPDYSWIRYNVKMAGDTWWKYYRTTDSSTVYSTRGPRMGEITTPLEALVIFSDGTVNYFWWVSQLEVPPSIQWYLPHLQEIRHLGGANFTVAYGSTIWLSEEKVDELNLGGNLTAKPYR